LDLAQLEKDPRRPILLFLADAARLWLCGCDGQPRWKLHKVKAPCAVQWVGGNRVFLAERTGERGNEVRLTERNLDGKVLWVSAGAQNQPPRGA
jgi:hypothetical protein